MELTIEEKAARYDEIHNWMLWLKRRVIKRRIRPNIRVFLDAMKKLTGTEEVQDGI